MLDVTPDAAIHSCAVVRRYLEDALFGGDEVALRETVADSELSERAWLFWAAFADRVLGEVDVLFANADGSQVACHFTGTAVRVGPWITPTLDDGATVDLECTATFTVTAARIATFRETWR